jgi:hypothetical protein
MDMAADVRAHAPHSHDQEQPSQMPSPGHDENDDILSQPYFDHSQPLDNTALDALLDTKFDDEDDSAATRATAAAANWRPACQSATSQPHQQSSSIKMQSFDYNDYAPPLELLPSQAVQASRSQVYGPPLHAHHGLPMAMHRPNPYNQHQQMMAHMMAHEGVSNNHYYATPSPVALPTMNDLYHDPASHLQHSNYPSPDNVSGRDHDTNDLMDYDNAIPEEDEAGANVDRCYAQLLYRCLKEAPNHTMALKEVYEWVRQHSQKARDSVGTGWQNSVRHNLSMNAVSPRRSTIVDHLHCN